MALLDVDDLRTYFHTRDGIVRAVDGVSFSIEKEETLGLVGESGSGKSVANYSLLGLIPMPPGRIESGAARFGDCDLLHCPASELRAIRGKRISMIFQDPMTALNPYLTIGDQVMEPLLVHEHCTRRDARDRAVAMLDSVGIQDAAQRLYDYPHQFSGGMRQRVTIAMALITHPSLLIADEPTTALDVTVQAQILALIKRMQRELGMAVLIITHNLGVIAATCDRVLVMYAGKILESAETRQLFYNPKHPYTKALMASMPSTRSHGGPWERGVGASALGGRDRTDQTDRTDRTDKEQDATLYTIPGMPPDLSLRVEGCPFAPRCEYAIDRCTREAPVLREVDPGHASACVRVQAGEL